MTEWRPGLRPFVAVADFLSHRRWPFWIAVVTGIFGACVFLSLLPNDRAAERAADRLADVRPVEATEVLWHVVDGQLDGVAVVVPGPTSPFTVDLAGIDGPDVDVFDGWQPAPADGGGGGADYVPPLSVRVDLTNPPVAMREADVGDYADGLASVMDLLLGLAGVATAIAAVVVSARQDQQLVPPRRRTARHF